MTQAPVQARQPDLAGAALTNPAEAAGDSLVVAVWTLVSRITGLLRVVVLGAVLGPTLFANLYQATSTLPQTVYYGLLAGSLVSSLLVPALVRWVDVDDPWACARVAGGFLGVLFAGLALVLPVLLLVTPPLLRVSSSASGAEAAQAEQTARWLVLLLLPQVFLYAVAGCSAAVLHARRRFALAAAAPAVENVGCVLTLVLAATIHGGSLGRDPSTAQLLLLGGGTTAAVGLHAALQWYGARRCGVVVRLRAGWRDAEVMAVLRRSWPALVQSALGAVQLLAALVVTNRVAGGVVAYQIALSFYFLPIALGATPVALSLLPRLSRLAGGDARVLRDATVRNLRFGAFLTAPAAVVLCVLAPALAQAVSFGKMDGPTGRGLVTAALTALAVGVVAEAAFLVGTYASYARGDTLAPLRSMAVKCAVTLVVLGVALTTHGGTTLALVGCAVSLGALAGAAHLLRALVSDLPPGEERLTSSAWRVAAAAAAMALPLVVARQLLVDVTGHLAVWVGQLTAVALAGAVFVVVAHRLGVPEAAWLRTAARSPLTGRRS